MMGIFRSGSVFCVFMLIFSHLNPLYADDTEHFVGSYLCIADAIGGVSFDEAAGKWESTKFISGERYILNVKAAVKVEDEFNKKFKQTYIISFEKHGSNSDILGKSCFTNSNELRTVNPLASFISEYGYFDCNLVSGELRANLENGRFMRSYNVGYVDGADNNDNTPFIEIGVCSKVN